VFVVASILTVAAAHAAPTITVPAGIDHAPWDALLATYVDERRLVDYAAWSNTSTITGA
jgi:hypothetical protein